MGAAALAGCSSDVPEVYPEGSDEIRISLSKGISTRAADGYRDWDENTDPQTLGVIAYTDENPQPGTYIYNNVSFSAPAEGTVWDITAGTKAKWSDFATATAFDFFGYMPHMENATVGKSGNTYTLTLAGVPGISTEPYVVATTPVHYTSAFGHLTPVPFQMDQLMTAFEFQFALGATMSGLRTFKITKVQLSHVLTSATVSQVYTLTAGTWAKGDVTLHPASNHTAEAALTSAEGIKIGYNNTSDYVAFPGMLYMIPYDLTAVAPRIEVTYDVYDQDGYKTRSATSEIVLNTTNFSALGTVESAHKNVVQIKIVPDQLHTLSDADQSTSGYLVVGE